MYLKHLAVQYSSKVSWHNIFVNFVIRHPITKIFSHGNLERSAVGPSPLRKDGPTPTCCRIQYKNQEFTWTKILVYLVNNCCSFSESKRPKHLSQHSIFVALRRTSFRKMSLYAYFQRTSKKLFSCLLYEFTSSITQRCTEYQNTRIQSRNTIAYIYLDT